MVASSMSCHAKLSFLCNGDVFHDAVDSNTNLDPTIFNLLHWNDDVLNLEDFKNFKNSNNSNVCQFTTALNLFFFETSCHLHRVNILNDKEGSGMSGMLTLLVSCQLTSPGKHFLAKVTSVRQHPCVQRAFVDLEV